MKDAFTLEEEKNEGRYNEDIDYDYMYWFDTVLGSKQYFKEFESAIAGLKELNQLILNDVNLQQVLWRQIYVGAIGSMEVFLADAFINITLDKPKYLKRFIETHPEFKNRKFEMQHVYQVYENIVETAKKVMYDIVYHDLSKVRNMYKETFHMNFPDIANASKAVYKRHDLVHRNGKTKSGDKPHLTSDEVSKALLIVESLVASIKDEFQKADVDLFAPEDYESNSD